MTALIKSIKTYFSKKENVVTTAAPEGMCPICWGHSEWDGQYYELKKDKHLKPNSEQYESFISKVVDKHIKTTHKHEDQYICTTCDKQI
jgi:ribosomal protein L44E